MVFNIRNLKYFIKRLVIAVFFSLSIAVIYGHYFIAENILKKAVESRVKSFVELFKNDVWKNHKSIISQLNKSDIKNWEQDQKFIAFAIDVINFINNYPAIKISLYDNNKRKIISSNTHDVTDLNKKYHHNQPKNKNPFDIDTDNIISQNIFDLLDYYVFEYNVNIDPVEDINSNTIISKFFTEALFYNIDGSINKGAVLLVAVPIMDESMNIESILEIYIDISDSWYYLHELRMIGLVSAIGLSIFLYVLLFLSSLEAQSIIDKQQLENNKLIEAREKAEIESLEKSKFLANVSHELRTPLNAIIGFSDIIKNEAMGPIENKQYKDYIADINSSGIHLLSLINDILDYSKASAEKLKIELIELDVRKIIVSSIRLVFTRANESGINIEKELPEKSAIILGDSRRLKQCILNILSNAVKFTPNGGTITLSCKISSNIDGNNNVIIKISDTGIGIAQKDIAKALSPFGQVDSTLSRKYEGTGLGLPFTKKLTELMNGQFEIESKLGFGTTITLIFPYIMQTDSEAGLGLE